MFGDDDVDIEQFAAVEARVSQHLHGGAVHRKLYVNGQYLAEMSS